MPKDKKRKKLLENHINFCSIWCMVLVRHLTTYRYVLFSIMDVLRPWFASHSRPVDQWWGVSWSVVSPALPIGQYFAWSQHTVCMLYWLCCWHTITDHSNITPIILIFTQNTKRSIVIQIFHISIEENRNHQINNFLTTVIFSLERKFEFKSRNLLEDEKFFLISEGRNFLIRIMHYILDYIASLLLLRLLKYLVRSWVGCDSDKLHNIYYLPSSVSILQLNLISSCETDKTKYPPTPTDSWRGNS